MTKVFFKTVDDATVPPKGFRDIAADVGGAMDDAGGRPAFCVVCVSALSGPRPVSQARIQSSIRYGMMTKYQYELVYG